MTGWFQPTHLTGQLIYQGMETEIPLGRELYIVRVEKGDEKSDSGKNYRY